MTRNITVLLWLTFFSQRLGCYLVLFTHIKHDKYTEFMFFFIRCAGEATKQCWAYVNASAQCQDLSHRKWDKRKEKPKLSFCIVSTFSEMIRSATPFPLVSLFFMFIGFVLSNIGHVRPHRTILAFVSGIFFILSGTPIVLFSCLLVFCFFCSCQTQICFSSVSQV